MRCVSTVVVISAAPYRKIGGGPATRQQTPRDIAGSLVDPLDLCNLEGCSSEDRGGGTSTCPRGPKFFVLPLSNFTETMFCVFYMFNFHPV